MLFRCNYIESIGFIMRIEIFFRTCNGNTYNFPEEKENMQQIQENAIEVSEFALSGFVLLYRL